MTPTTPPNAADAPQPSLTPAGEPSAIPTESALRILIGLVVVWVVLVMMFEAHRMSNSYVQVGTVPAGGSLRAGAGIEASSLNARTRLGLPVSMAWWGISPRQALDLVARHVGYELDPEGANARIANRSRDIELKDVSLAQAIHQMLDDPNLGFCIRNGHFLSVFPQKLNIEPGATQPARMDWTADLPPATQPMVVSPGGAAGLSVVLTPDRPSQSGEPGGVSIEIWREDEWIAMTRIAFDNEGRGSADATSGQRAISVELERTGVEPTAAPAGYRLHLRLGSRLAGPGAMSEATATTPPRSAPPAIVPDSDAR